MYKILYKLVILSFAICLTKGSQCIMEGVDNWLLVVTVNIMDTDREVEILRRTTDYIEEITSITQGEGLNKGPYLTMTLVESSFVISTNEAFNTYENDETSLTIGSVVQFRCTSGLTRALVITVNITDTNNHSPEFNPPNYEFTIAPPVPPRFLVTDCINYVIARDVDLTTYRIDFELEGSDLFEITFNESSTEPKNFKAILRTATFIRTIPEPIVLRVRATDVDRTGNAPRTVDSTITIHANSEFEFPDEPIFSQAYYMATYTETNHLELQNSIYLRQGFDDQVTFSFDGDLKQYFQLVPSNNQIIFQVLSAIPIEEYPENGQIYLVVSAERLYTSGAMATVIVQFPAAKELKFEELAYSGTLEDNIVNLPPIVLNVDITVELKLEGDYSEHFSAQQISDQLHINVDSLPNSALLENNYFMLTLAASADNIVAYTTIFLNVIKNDYVTPTFSKHIYYGRYIDDNNIDIEEVIVSQGLDGTVTFEMDEEYREYFDIIRTDYGLQVLRKSPLPKDLIFQEKVVVFNIIARKPRTVVANTIVSINFPEDLILPTVLIFSKNTYSGRLDQNSLTTENIILEHGYSTDTKFVLGGDHDSYFIISEDVNKVFITTAPDASYEDLFDSKFIVLEVTATSESSISAISTVVIDVVSNTESSLIFEEPYYSGALVEPNRLEFTQTISLRHGFDDSVEFHLEGDTNGWITIVNTGSNSLKLALNENVSIPEEVLQQNTHLIYTLVANKLRASGQTIIVIEVLRDNCSESNIWFTQDYYVGYYEEGTITLDSITVTPYSDDIILELIGGNFTPVYTQDKIIKIRQNDSVQINLESNFLVLTLEARSLTSRAHTIIVLKIIKYDEQTNSSILNFSQAFYVVLFTESEGLKYNSEIVLSDGYDETTRFSLERDSSEWFRVDESKNPVVLKLTNSLPTEVIQNNNYLSFVIRASNGENMTTRATIIVEIITDDPLENRAAFDKVLYIGQFQENVVTHEAITILNHDGSPVLLSGSNAQLFEASIDSNGVITVVRTSSGTIPDDATSIILEMTAGAARAVLLINVIPSDNPSENRAAFDKVLYIGKLQGNIVTHEAITVLHHDGSQVLLSGSYAQLFEATIDLNGLVTVVRTSSGTIPDDLTSIILEMTAGAARAVLVVTVIPSDNPSENRAVFDKALYIGQLQENIVTHEAITVLHHDGSPVLLSGSYAQLFDATIDSNGVVTVVRTSSGTIPDDLTSVLLEMTAGAASGVFVVTVIPSENRAAFDKVLYIGQLQENIVTHEAITVFHHDGSPVLLSGIYAQLFDATIDSNGVVTVVRTSSGTIPDNATSIILEIIAGAARAVLVLNIPPSDNPSENRAAFDKVLYIGQLQENIVTHEAITVFHHDGSPVLLSGIYAQLFDATIDSNGVVTVVRTSSGTIPDNATSIILEIIAGAARAVLVLNIPPSDNPSENRATFDKVLYIGQLQENVVTHETITILHHDGSPVLLSGEYAQLFEASISNGVVTVTSTSSLTIPGDITSIPLEIKAGEAIAVLILIIIQTEQPVLPTVTFSSSEYTLRTDVSHTGVIGTVHATADNGEPITYALLLENDHLRERLSVNSDGEISLSAPAASGGYNFQVQATAIVNHVSAVAEVSLWIEAVTICDTDIVLHPLTVIERLEEEPHRDLVILNQQQYTGCEFELINHWPRDQNWLYVDAEGLHARVIDREHESIAFMHVSQVQVELVLHCVNDSTRHKRSVKHFSSYDYGSKSWILTDPFLYNSRRSLVNLIVIDINDNTPIFVGKENEPISVGYPTNGLEDTIRPRSLVELKATDADIGENAEILYWSAEKNLAVAPTTGFVHVRNSALLEDNARFTIYATDLNGRGLNGSIDIVVKLLDENHIAVVTISDAFLDGEQSIIKDISTALGYDVKILNAAVVSTNTSNDTMTRKKRETDNTGASLQLYVYGIDENNAVHVNQLTSDISNSDLIAVNIARVLSLEDHLLQICPLSARETALLAATISLAVLFFLIITVITVREFLKRKKGQSNYEQFSDANSLASRNNFAQVIPKLESPGRSRLNIEELRKSEKRLQDMLNEDRRVPTKQIGAEPINESIIDMPVPLTPEPEQQMPIVIQSIDKLKDSNDDSDGDEFGEVKNNRKSVVTFNENVEKIIHIEDRSASISSDSTDFEVYKF